MIFCDAWYSVIFCDILRYPVIFSVVWDYVILCNTVWYVICDIMIFYDILRYSITLWDILWLLWYSVIFFYVLELQSFSYLAIKLFEISFWSNLLEVLVLLRARNWKFDSFASVPFCSARCVWAVLWRSARLDWRVQRHCRLNERSPRKVGFTILLRVEHILRLY